jgi:hypothetical protein
MSMTTFMLAVYIVIGIVATFMLLRIAFEIIHVVFRIIDKTWESKTGKFLILAAGALIARTIWKKQRRTNDGIYDEHIQNEKDPEKQYTARQDRTDYSREYHNTKTLGAATNPQHQYHSRN